MTFSLTCSVFNALQLTGMGTVWLKDIRSDIYFEIIGPTAFLSVRTDGPTVFGKSVNVC